MPDVIDTQLDFAIDNALNVMLVGKHGVGKTARILGKWDERNINYLYFSASTMDPFVDFVGVPKEMTDPETGEAYLGFVRPQALNDESLEALFFDEYNRSPKKTRNAVMELIQFKSINGRKFPNLKFIWVAINPDDDEDETYDVEIMDAAQSDRFHMRIDVPYEASASYFVKKYPGSVGASAVGWWNALTEKGRKKISPRRLDYAVDAYTKGASKSALKSFFPTGVNVAEFVKALASGDLKSKIVDAIGTKNSDVLSNIVNGSETRSVVDGIDDIVETDANVFKHIVDAANQETLVRIVSDFSKTVRAFMKDDQYKEALTGLLEIDSIDSDLTDKVNSLLGVIDDVSTKDDEDADSIYTFFDEISKGGVE